MKKIMVVFILTAISLTMYAAVGCDLNDPDRDVKRLFPNSTGYQTHYFSVQRLGGTELLETIETELGDKFSGLYETIDVPYTLYEVYREQEVIGYIHGVNEKGRFGGMQVFLALDMDGVIRGFYLQKLSSRYGRQYRSDNFYNSFVGLHLNDFADYDVAAGKGTGKAALIKDPTSQNDPDFLAILRGVKKNLILVKYFLK